MFTNIVLQRSSANGKVLCSSVSLGFWTVSKAPTHFCSSNVCFKYISVRGSHKHCVQAVTRRVNSKGFWASTVRPILCMVLSTLDSRVKCYVAHGCCYAQDRLVTASTHCVIIRCLVGLTACFRRRDVAEAYSAKAIGVFAAPAGVMAESL